MSPYADFSYFLFLLYPLAILILLGVLGRLGPRAVVLVSLGVILFQYSNPLGGPAAVADGLRQLRFLALDVLVSLLVVLGFARLRRRGRNQALFYGAVGLALLPLVVVKLDPLLSGPAVRGVASPVLGGWLDPTGFLGVSYLTFRVIDAIVVVHDGILKEEPPPGALASYLLFVPTISSGPIDRYRRFADDLASLPRSGRRYLGDVEVGIQRIAQGFLYKFILGYLVYRYGLQPVATASDLGSLVRYTYAYSLYLFFDFAGYSAFAIGVGRFFGIRVPENFNAPFLSRDFKDVWNRWHISLSWWMRDHVYMRFMLHAGKRRWFGGNRQITSYVGLLLTMTLMGLWHGLFPHYVVYGLYQGVMLIVSDLAERFNRQRRIIPAGPLAHGLSVVVTVNLFCFGLLIFSGRLFR